MGELGVRILNPKQASVLAEEAVGFTVRCVALIDRMQISALE